MSDMLVLAIVIAASAAAIVWNIRSSWERRAHAILDREIRREFNRHQAALFKRHAQIQRRLDRHHRILQYLARRLS